ncbi:ABC-type dipeptide/oligopeptide/nickel transport system ATPase subunit [Crossiella equi]|uniref:ABC-type dipeptide/oligopeptide/nickel transport system ATPase subunit n=1 Tax=Crossiella equi TaxID=130796 RepID=A0ABS5AMP6_9PSEU|nr:ABC transporter ATP-binding protein [Crossiella equi]MBP2477474.1 ABC-type dipeptide/oligopeptide/nickel transport system ATPase subunit [Crossiella equi]
MIDLRVEALTVHYGHGANRTHALREVDLHLPAGHSLGLVGESGSGKSTLAKAVLGLAKVAGGRILLGGKDITNARGAAARHRGDHVQLVFQDPYSSLNPRLTIGESVREVLAAHGVAKPLREAETAALLERVGLDGSAGPRYPHQFSGGQRQRIAIARALAAKPSLLVLDEVTSALDVSVQAQILNLLRELRAASGLTYLLISHDLSVIRYLCEDIAVLRRGELVEAAPARELFTAPGHEYTRALLDSVPRLIRG